MAESYARTINKYQTELKGKVQTDTDIAVPSLIEFNAPPQYAKQYSTEKKKNIDCVYGALDPAIKAVDAHGSIGTHRNEYVFFKTDHHWTGLGGLLCVYRVLFFGRIDTSSPFVDGEKIEARISWIIVLAHPRFAIERKCRHG